MAVMTGADPTATEYTVDECLGSARPYPAPEEAAVFPDSLTPVFINHVGRHGARFISSPATIVEMLTVLHRADSAGVLTPLGKRLQAIGEYVMEVSHNRWGALDSLGMAEQRGIASRMFRACPRLFDNGKVTALSSYSPRCVMSMYEFTHQLDRLNNSVEITTTSGRQNSPLMRPFDTDTDFVEWYKGGEWKEPYDMFFDTTAPAAPARRLVSDRGFLDNHAAAGLAWNEYKLLTGMAAMGMRVDYGEFFTLPEMNALWQCENLGHYLRRTATTLSMEPAYVASNLLLNLIETADEGAAGTAAAAVHLRFGHAETLMPLLSLMRLKGCYYMTNYFDTVALHWRDFDIVPMGANLQMILFKTAKGRCYVRFDLNEVPVPLLPDSDKIYIPWEQAREYLVRCLPLHLQI